MLSKDQANCVAEELLAQARSSKFGFIDPAGIPAPPAYQCRELRALPQGLQHEVVRQARHSVGTNQTFVLIFLVWMAGCAALWVFGQTLMRPPFSPIPVLFLSLMLPFAVRLFLVRRAVKLIASELSQSWNYTMQ